MKIFVSDRRQDSTVVTGRIYDWLIGACGKRAVFIHRHRIHLGKGIDPKATSCHLASKRD